MEKSNDSANGFISFSRDFLKETVTVSFTKDDTTENKVYDLKDIQILTKDKNEKNR